ncbi:MAG TPA: flagellar basal body-associated FliL family protein [Steroidobacteraceae bacterium]|jgi:flagellar FliL protein|nr:flagellar basal body-associated FliL family protein [Steroidobacteraceae bacterium]
MSAQAAKKEPAEAAKEGDGGAKKSKLPLIIIAAVVVLGGGGAGAFFAFKPKAGAAAETTAADKADKDDKADKGGKKGPPLFYKFDPAFVVNFGGEGSARYLQVTVEAMSRDQAILTTLKEDEPAVRNDLVMLFSAQDNASLMSQEGKEKLRGETLDIVRKVLNEEGAKGKQVEAVYFTSFVIQ